MHQRRKRRRNGISGVQNFSYRSEKTGEVITSPTLKKPDKIKVKVRFSILNDKEEENIAFGDSEFIKKEFLLDESNGLLVNDKLTVLFEGEIITFKSDNQYNQETSRKSTLSKSKLSLEYGNISDSPLFTDCIIKVGDTEIKVHKAVLAARSLVFHNILSSPLEESLTNVIEIKDFPVEVVREMLKYIYTNEVSNIQNMASKILVNANKFN
uniref:Speckle-type POZ protein-like (inferred by orthology to a human protein) n=1 Tax=Strongyloides venezuelensis TaxID=75913 RepID=A0A0K0FFU8_STRVS